MRLASLTRPERRARLAPVAALYDLVQFAWDAVGGATSYQLEIGTTTGATDVLVLDVGPVVAYAYRLPPGTYFTRVRDLPGNGVSTEAVIYV